jgi:hypothetical protein
LTRERKIELLAAFKFLGTDDPQLALQMLQHEFIVYGFNSTVEGSTTEHQQGMLWWCFHHPHHWHAS